MGPKKTKLKKIGNLGFNHESWVVFNAEFESGIENGRTLAENMKNDQLFEIMIFFLTKS